jgi:hypothetical protein
MTSAVMVREDFLTLLFLTSRVHLTVLRKRKHVSLVPVKSQGPCSESESATASSGEAQHPSKLSSNLSQKPTASLKSTQQHINSNPENGRPPPRHLRVAPGGAPGATRAQTSRTRYVTAPSNLPLLLNSPRPEYIVTIFTPSNPIAHGFDLLLCRYKAAAVTTTITNGSHSRSHSRSGSDEVIVLPAIAYLSADKSSWKEVLKSSKAYYGITPALQEFTKELQREMGNMYEAQVFYAARGTKRSRAAEEDKWKEGENEKMRRL